MQILLLDGGLGTTLESPPFNITFTPETPLWSSHLLFSSPATLAAAHRAFYVAGADILLTATYQASVEGFARTEAADGKQDALRYMRSAIPLVRGVIPRTRTSPAVVTIAEAQTQTQTQPQAQTQMQTPGARPCRVALSLGPYGATLSPVSAEYSGLYPAEMDREDALRRWHAERLRVFAGDAGSWDGVEYVAFETLRRADEVRAVRGAVFDVVGRGRSPGRKAWWVCGVFPGEEEDDVPEDDVRRWVRAAVAGDSSGSGSGMPRPWGLGVNCTRVDRVARIVDIMRDEIRRLCEDGRFVDEWDASSGRPWLVLYPDGTKGEKYDPVAKTWVAGGTAVRRPWDESLWDVVQRQAEGDWEGIIIGGCCRAGPDDIAALRRRIDGDKTRGGCILTDPVP
ncbi:Homocysteine S-methyltransferase [Aspergillus lucknowensis]|uniref:Homocysteine S-methyltransferase n=1 Tax=Aspergillus lucknowensis TaxID=176173 RepID=A0ABR4LIN7_9EURO